MLLNSSYLNSQTINFTIDTAVDENTVSITETIGNGTDTYTLNVEHPGNEELDELTSGDFIFYLSTGGTVALQPYTISITKNNNPVTFTLNGVDYDTLEAGSISITNQDDAEISANKLYAIGSGALTFTNTTNATGISAFKIVPNSNGELNDFGFHNIQVEISNVLNVDNNTLSTKGIMIYPNPTEGLITIENSSNTPLKEVQIIGLNGRLLKSYDFSSENKELNLDYLSSGIYILKINTSKSSISKKILIK
ncbi:hypothetical protein LPB136_12830 [Tenacibaculum todarodis]|uniref:Secretion system C-terminal sorting domain-containing protein n=2 Tax=Tenacibaculum todarodis TaxID=1850252 RepID=A0A1L3JM87_9FLAO|nr:hypothetical protein LPB136_12830 [Tenacibaculum todarodis]